MVLTLHALHIVAAEYIVEMGWRNHIHFDQAKIGNMKDSITDQKSLQWIVRTAERIIRISLTTVTDL